MNECFDFFLFLARVIYRFLGFFPQMKAFHHLLWTQVNKTLPSSLSFEKKYILFQIEIDLFSSRVIFALYLFAINEISLNGDTDIYIPFKVNRDSIWTEILGI